LKEISMTFFTRDVGMICWMMRSLAPSVVWIILRASATSTLSWC